MQKQSQISKLPYMQAHDYNQLIDTAWTCLTQVAKRNIELKMILNDLDADYTQFCRDILEEIHVAAPTLTT